MSTKNYTAQVYAPNEYINPGNEGEIALSTSPNSVLIHNIASTNYSNSGVRFDITVGKSNCLDRDLKVKFPCKFKMRVHTPKATALLIDDAKRCLADTVLAPTGFLNMCNNITVTFNGNSTIEINEPSLQLQTLLCANNPYTMNKGLSGCLLKPDTLPDYNMDESADDISVVETQNDIRQLRRTTTSSTESPFTGILESPSGVRMPPYRIELIPGSTSEFFVHMDIESFIPCSLFNTQDETKFSFYGVDVLSVNMNLHTRYGRLLSQKYSKSHYTPGTDAPTGFESIISIKSLEFTGPPKLRCNIIIPPTYMSTKMIDPNTSSVRDYAIGYKHYEILSDHQIPGYLRGARTARYQHANISASCIPKRLWVAVIPDYDIPIEGTTLAAIADQDEKLTLRTRTFARIDNLTLHVGATTSLHGSDKESLYYMSTRNGLEKKQEEAFYLSGFPVIVDLRKDCSLGGEIIGASTSQAITVTFDYTNLCTDPNQEMKYKLLVIAEHDAVLQCDRGIFSSNYVNIAAKLTDSSLQDIKSLAPNYLVSKGIYLGGSLWGKIKSGFNWVVDKAPSIYNGVKTAVDAYRSIRGGETKVIGGKSIADERFA